MKIQAMNTTGTVNRLNKKLINKKNKLLLVTYQF